MEFYKFVKDYRDNPVLRSSFNRLAEKTFCLDFEPWYQHGFWTEKYNPYSIVYNGEVVSSISVSQMEFTKNGEKKHYIQLGAVMTDEAYRNQGLSRKLMEEILLEYEGKTDGIYLFANKSVLDFYPKFGFRKEIQWEYSIELDSKENASAKKASVQKVSMETKEDWEKFIPIIQSSVANSSLDFKQPEITMFYLSNFMKDNVYYIPEHQAYVVAERDNNILYLQQIYSSKELLPEQAAVEFGSNIKKVIFEFTPLHKECYQKHLHADVDDTLFVIGEDLKDFIAQELAFPILSHT